MQFERAKHFEPKNIITEYEYNYVDSRWLKFVLDQIWSEDGFISYSSFRLLTNWFQHITYKDSRERKKRLGILNWKKI